MSTLTRLAPAGRVLAPGGRALAVAASYPAYPPTYDPHAQALFDRGGYSLTATYWPGTAYQISGQSLLAALSRLAVGLKTTVVDGASLWSRLAFIYPFAGDSLAGNLANLKSLDGSQDGMLASSTSYALSGQGFMLVGNSNVYAYLDTGFNPAQQLPLDSNHLSVYATTEGSGIQVDIGSVNDADTYYFDLLADYQGTAYFENSSGGMLAASSGGTGLGLTTGTRTATTVASLYRNGVLRGTSSGINAAYPDRSVGIGNRAGGPYPTGRTLAWATGGLSRTSNQEAATYTLVQQYETDLNRAV